LQSQETLKRTPLFDLHVELGGKMVPFAGYEMPVQFTDGIMAEHHHTRAKAGLFDVSHMGQFRVDGDDPVAAMERAVPADVRALAAGRMRYSLLTADDGGILDDLIITRWPGYLSAVVNASRKAHDLARLTQVIGSAGEIVERHDLALLALQGPAAEVVLARHAPASAALRFMDAAEMAVAGLDCVVSRSGYTGEDGFEISVAADAAADLARRLLAEPEVLAIGLGARDSLRLEAGLCLYGHDIDETTTPVEAGLVWAIDKRRRETRGFPGADVILKQLQEGAARRRVGLQLEGRAPAREGAEITDAAGATIGMVTSGGFGPTLGGPIAMGYVPKGLAAAGTAVGLSVRGRSLPAKVAKMPFVPQRYKKG
jgi:aminomethyltransferase